MPYNTAMSATTGMGPNAASKKKKYAGRGGTGYQGREPGPSRSGGASKTGGSGAGATTANAPLGETFPGSSPVSGNGSWGDTYDSPKTTQPTPYWAQDSRYGSQPSHWARDTLAQQGGGGYGTMEQRPRSNGALGILSRYGRNPYQQPQAYRQPPQAQPSLPHWARDTLAQQGGGGYGRMLGRLAPMINTGWSRQPPRQQPPQYQPQWQPQQSYGGQGFPSPYGGQRQQAQPYRAPSYGRPQAQQQQAQQLQQMQMLGRLAPLMRMFGLF